MKKIAKIFVPLLAAFCLFTAVAALAACGGDDNTSKYAAEDDDTNWDYTTYVVYLLYPDGSPVADVDVQICSGTNCINGETNEDGRASITFPSSQQGETVYMHFPDVIVGIDATPYSGPDGYTLPAGSSAYAGYDHVWYLTQKVTTLTFVAA
ncbi:MAG: hypothetical protein LUI60_04500 [Clostridia bacterium]|nr:hypothetical protein [Clostridia bacterium]